jgi:hypothetical protein
VYALIGRRDRKDLELVEDAYLYFVSNGRAGRKSRRDRHRPLKPMPLWQSLLFFGVPAIIAALDHHVLWPWLVSLGLEGNPLNWRSFRERYRLGPLRWREWGWTLGGIVVFAALAYASNSLAPTIFDRLGFVPPDTAPSGPVTNVPPGSSPLSLNGSRTRRQASSAT